MTEEIDLEELERRLRERWQPEAHRPAVDAEAMEVARKLMDKSNADRLAQTSRGERFKYRSPRPPVVTAEYFYAPAVTTFLGTILRPDGWTVNVYLDGRKSTSTHSLSRESCLRIVGAMQRRGIRVRALETEAMKLGPIQMRRVSPPPGTDVTGSKHYEPSKRRSAIDRLAGFKW